MDLKWIEDFASLARTGSFSRSAEERNVTQPAFSRRIRALETWLGVPLVDRSTFPTTLTDAGRAFRETADETIRALHGSRAALRAKAAPRKRAVAVAALHTLALTFFPGWLRAVEGRTGPLETRLLSDDYHACTQALVEGGYDFLLTFHHSGVPLPVDAERYPHRRVGSDALLPVRAPMPASEARALPRLAYNPNSFLGRLARQAAGVAVPEVPAGHVNENALAEGLRAMAVQGFGLAWLPQSIAARDLAEGRLVAAGDAVPLEIRLYRNGDHRREIVGAVWDAASALAADAMPAPHGAD